MSRYYLKTSRRPVPDIPRVQSERVETEFEVAADIEPDSPRVSHDSVYMRPSPVGQATSPELRKQLSQLQRTVNAQGELLKRLLDQLEGNSRPASRASARQNDIGMALNRNRS